MTTIDRIMNNLRNFYVPADEKHIREILEAELTVNRVDELVEKRENTRQTLAYIASRWCGEDAGKYKQIMDCISDLKDLKQTPVNDSQPKEVENEFDWWYIQWYKKCLEDKKIEIGNEMIKLKSSLDKLKFMWLNVTYNTYYSLVEEIKQMK